MKTINPAEGAPRHKLATSLAGQALCYVIHMPLRRTQGGFLNELKSPYRGKSGQQSIDPLFYFELCLVDYLGNITTV